MANVTVRDYEKLQYACTLALSEADTFVLLDPSVTTQPDYYLHQLLMQLRGYLWAEASTDIVEVPLTWWDHVKQRFCPSWGVKTRKIATTVKTIRPDLRMLVDGPYLRQAVETRPTSKWDYFDDLGSR